MKIAKELIVSKTLQIHTVKTTQFKKKRPNYNDFMCSKSHLWLEES